MTADLSGQAALITGGAAGIGSATVRAFASSGASVWVMDTDAAALRALLAELGGSGFSVSGESGDAGSEDDILAAVCGCSEQFGRLDHVHANAGIGVDKHAEDVSITEWTRVLDVNLTGAFVLAREALRRMRAAGTGGSITFTSSPHALVTTQKTAAYAASKAALLGLTRSLALEGAPYGIRVNSILPGAVDTPMVQASIARSADPEKRRDDFARQHPLGRLCRPADVADAVLYLATAGFVTGIALPVDGGLLAQMATDITY